MDIISQLFDTSDFPPRWQCGHWTPAHGWLHILSDLGVWSAYVAIPCVLGYFILRRKDLPFRFIFVLFGAFILSCGTTHLMESFIFWWPAYRLAGAIKLVTAIVSWFTVMALVPITPQVLAMRSPEELEREIKMRRHAEEALQTANSDLAEQVAKLRISEERFRLLVEGTRDHAIILLDPEGKVASWNLGAERINQYSAGEIIGKHFSCFYSPEDVKTGKPTAQLAAATKGRHEGEGLRIRKDGTQFWASVVITPLHDSAGKLRGYSKITQDITERKLAEESAQRLMHEESARKAAEEYAEAIREQREQLRVTLHSIGDAVIVTDADGDVTLLNSVAENLSGWTNAEAIGKPLEHVFHIIDEQTKQLAENPIARALSEGSIVGLANHTVLIAKDGTHRAIDDSAAPIRDDQGHMIGAVLVFRDISERKRLEKELLERADQLAEADRRKTEFLATLAHELRNPLAPIHNALQFMRMSGAASDALVSVREMMERQVAIMVRLVDDLMDVSRITRGRVELRREHLELAVVIAHAVETSRPLIDQAGHTFHVTVADEPLHVVGDLTRLAQVVANLLNNSAKFTPPGGNIWLSTEKRGDEAIIRVRDDGMGIPVEMLKRVFEMFAQVDRTLARSHSGLGIGLTLVRSLIELHGGRVEATSLGRGCGSEFIIHLPLAPASNPNAELEPGDSNTSMMSPLAFRVLVVDDNVDSANTLAMVVRMNCAEVRIAHSGPSALVVATEFLPDIILLDIGLPDMDGYEVARRIRAEPTLKNTVLVAQTGWGQAEDQRRSREAGFDEHLVKPVDLGELQRVFAHLEQIRKDRTK